MNCTFAILKNLNMGISGFLVSGNISTIMNIIHMSATGWGTVLSEFWKLLEDE